MRRPSLSGPPITAECRQEALVVFFTNCLETQREFFKRLLSKKKKKNTKTEKKKRP